jgi:magnesium chelatase family protein
MRARERQRERLGGEGIFANASMTSRLIRKYCAIDSESEHLLERAMTRLDSPPVLPTTES